MAPYQTAPVEFRIRRFDGNVSLVFSGQDGIEEFQ